MNPAPAVLVWAQWLSDHSLAVTLVIALVALAIEGLWRVVAANQTTQTVPPGTMNPWASTWFTNAALLACAMALSWMLSPWLSPLFSDALSGRTGILAWLGAEQSSSAIHVILGILLLDLMSYSLHRVMHAVPIFWRVHQVHHSDTEMNASTHFRQHPLQFIAAIAMQLPLVWLLGIPGVSWVIYTVLGAVVQLWHHSTLPLPVRVDRWLSLVVVTPQFHRVHHHPERRFHDANYGSVFPLWDRVLGTIASASLDRAVGLRDRRPAKAGSTLSLTACLAMPFRTMRTTLANRPAVAVVKASVIGRKLKTRQKIQPNSRGTT